MFWPGVYTALVWWLLYQIGPIGWVLAAYVGFEFGGYMVTRWASASNRTIAVEGLGALLGLGFGLSIGEVLLYVWKGI